MIELNKREKRLLQMLIAIISLLVVYFLIISPLMNVKEDINTKFESNIVKLNKLDRIYEEYSEIKRKGTEYKSKLRNSTGVTTLIEENSKSVGILNNKSFIRERPSNIKGKYKKISTEVKFENVDITSILNFIYKMENSGKLLRVSYMRIRQTLKGRSAYDVTIKFDTLTSQ